MQLFSTSSAAVKEKVRSDMSVIEINVLTALSVITMGLFVLTVILLVYYKILDRQIQKYETEKKSNK